MKKQKKTLLRVEYVENKQHRKIDCKMILPESTDEQQHWMLTLPNGEYFIIAAKNVRRVYPVVK